MDQLLFDEKWELLRVWSQTLTNKVNSNLSPVRECLDPGTRLPEGCPSHASLALMHFGDVEQAFQDVEAAMDGIRAAINAHKY